MKEAVASLGCCRCNGFLCLMVDLCKVCADLSLLAFDWKLMAAVLGDGIFICVCCFRVRLHLQI